jgi:hypothetical protein
LIDKPIFLGLEDLANNLPKLSEYVGGETEEDKLDYDADDHRFFTDCRVRIGPKHTQEYTLVETILVDACRELLQRGSMKMLGAMLVTRESPPKIRLTAIRARQLPPRPRRAVPCSAIAGSASGRRG